MTNPDIQYIQDEKGNQSNYGERLKLSVKQLICLRVKWWKKGC